MVNQEAILNSFGLAHMTSAFNSERLAAARRESAVRQRKAMKEGADAQYFKPDTEAMRQDLHRRLPAGALATPTLVMWGLNDPSAPLSLGHELFAALATHNRKRTEFHVFARSGHYPFREHVERFNELLAGFVEAAGISKPATGKVAADAPSP